MNGPPSRELSRQERAAIRKQVTELCANYDSQDKSCRPLDCPCYMLHKWWTGSFCRYYRRGYFSETENLPGLRQGISSHHEPGVLFGFLPYFCQTEIRAGTQAPEQAEPGVICPQLNQKEA